MASTPESPRRAATGHHRETAGGAGRRTSTTCKKREEIACSVGDAGRGVCLWIRRELSIAIP